MNRYNKFLILVFVGQLFHVKNACQIIQYVKKQTLCLISKEFRDATLSKLYITDSGIGLESIGQF